MPADVAKAILAGGTFVASKASDGGTALLKLASRLGLGGDPDAWHASIEDADVDSVIFVIGALTEGFHSKREAARSMVERKLNQAMLETMTQLEDTSTKLARRGVRTAWIAAGLQLVATFSGVALALWGQSYLEARRERQEVVRALNAADGEAQRSVEILATLPGSVADLNSPSGLRFQLVLRNPVGSLATLAQMPVFLSYCEPEVVSELLSLNVTLAWVPLPLRSGTASVPAGSQIDTEPNQPSVVAGVMRASELLRQCLGSLEAKR